MSFIVGMKVGSVSAKLRDNIKKTQRGSTAGQTLMDLSSALEDEKSAKGAYPDSIETLRVTPSDGDFSKRLLHEIKYFRTTEGYVAFVGWPHVVYYDTETGLHFEETDTEPGDTPNTHSPSAQGVGGR